jgi:Flp pilus assembly protein TadG
VKRFLHRFGCERGATALELAFVAPVFFTMIFGVIDVARVAWTLGSLHFAAESAARYASLNYDSSGNPPAASTVQTYALNAYHGESIGSNPFTYSATGCGNTVTAAYTYSLTIPFAGTWSIPLGATACFP